MAYGIVQQHHGLIQLDSQINVGLPSRYICLRAKMFPPLQKMRCEKLEHSGTETILVAEDDAIVRSLAVRALRQAGYDTLIATDGLKRRMYFKTTASEYRW